MHRTLKEWALYRIVQKGTMELCVLLAQKDTGKILTLTTATNAAKNRQKLVIPSYIT